MVLPGDVVPNSMMISGPDSGVQVLDRSIAVVAAVVERGALTLAQLVAITGLARPTTHRLAVALEVQGLLRRDDDGRFRPGGRLVGWGAAATRAWPIAELAQPVLDRLRDDSGESAQLFVRDGDRRRCIASADRTSGLRDTVPLGIALPLEKGSGGTVLLAFAGAAGARFDRVRAAGWADSRAERESGVGSVSAPVFAPSGAVAAAISVSGPLDRLGRRPGQRLAPLVRGAAAQLSEQYAQHRS